MGRNLHFSRCQRGTGGHFWFREMPQTRRIRTQKGCLDVLSFFELSSGLERGVGGLCARVLNSICCQMSEVERGPGKPGDRWTRGDEAASIPSRPPLPFSPTVSQFALIYILSQSSKKREDILGYLVR